MRYLPVIAVLVLTIYALVDCVRYQEATLPAGMPKALWMVLIVLFPVAGPLAWLVVSRASRTPGPRGARPARPGGSPSRRPAGPPAPDDDPEFLANLDRMRRSREREARAKQDPGPAPGEQPPPATSPEEQEPDKGDGPTSTPGS